MLQLRKFSRLFLTANIYLFKIQVLHRNIKTLQSKNCLVTVFPCNLPPWRCLTFQRIYSSNNPNLLLGLWPFIYKTTEMFKMIISYFVLQFSYSFTYRNADMKCSSTSFCDNDILWCHPIACKRQMYFQLSLLSLRKLIFGGREATPGNTSAIRRLVIQLLLWQNIFHNALVLFSLFYKTKTILFLHLNMNCWYFCKSKDYYIKVKPKFSIRK